MMDMGNIYVRSVHHRDKSTTGDHLNREIWLQSLIVPDLTVESFQRLTCQF